MGRKGYFFFLSLLMMSFILSAQTEQGKIIYEYSMDLHRNIPPEREELKAMIPQFNEQTYQLVFSETESLYKEVEESAPPRGRGRMGFAMRMPGTETYVNSEENEVVVRVEFLGKSYLVTEPLELGPWRMGDQMMEVEGYMCMMAWYHDTIQDQEVTAWFTPDIRPFTGPDRFVGLPGTVLALDINNGERVWVARHIELGEEQDLPIAPPVSGERISREEYLEMMQESRERMEGRGFRF
ncbi:MAG: GLPGLI family protein [Bacteroidales bacterium]